MQILSFKINSQDPETELHSLYLYKEKPHSHQACTQAEISESILDLVDQLKHSSSATDSIEFILLYSPPNLQCLYNTLMFMFFQHIIMYFWLKV